MNDIFKNFENISEELNKIKESKNKIKEQEQDEIKKSTIIINEKYEKRLKQTNEEEKNHKTKLSKLNAYLKEYSTFDKKILGNIISKLMTIVENKKYVYVNATHKTYERECTVFGSETFFQEKIVDLIVEKNHASKNYYDSNENDNHVNQIINSNKGILLESNIFENKSITLYYNFDNEIYPEIDYKSFSYVKEFIDILINYRYKNKTKEIKEKDLLKLLYDFINTKKDLITEKHNKLIEEEIKKKQEELEQKEKEESEKLIKKYIPKTLLINKIKDKDKEEIDNILNNIKISLGTIQGTVKANIIEELYSTNLMYISKLSLNGTVKNYYYGLWNKKTYSNYEINHDAFFAIFDQENYKGLNLTSNIMFYGLKKYNGSYIKDIINDKYFMIFYTPYDYYYDDNEDLEILKYEINEETLLKDLIGIGKFVEKESNIYEEKGRKYILTKKQV